MAILAVSVSVHFAMSQNLPLVKLERIGTLDRAISESSGLVKSQQYEGVYWTLNDSGDVARIFPVSQQGELLSKKHINSRAAGIYLVDTRNYDWEALTLDAANNLIIGDVGNNKNNRRNLRLYRIPEPDPQGNTAVLGGEEITVYYPEQLQFPAAQFNFDCEAVFMWDGAIHLLTKHRADTRTVLYRLDQTLAEESPLQRLGSFENGGMVCGAEASPDGKRLAIITYTHVWVIEAVPGKPLLEGDYYAGRIRAKQSEAICWQDNETLVLTNEQRQIYRMPLSSLIAVERPD